MKIGSNFEPYKIFPQMKAIVTAAQEPSEVKKKCMGDDLADKFHIHVDSDFFSID